MDDTTRSILDQITERTDKPRTLPGGHSGTVFYDCARLTPNDLARLAAAATGHLDAHSFDVAVGVAYAGVFFAAAVAGGREVAIFQKDGEIWGPSVAGKKVLIVSDVVCSGRELNRAASKVGADGGQLIGYACIVDRSDNKFGSAATPLFAAFRTNLA